ncbi:MAG: PAS domain S-box protein [Cyanobacteria bacterium P01_G01_bin.19]
MSDSLGDRISSKNRKYKLLEKLYGGTFTEVYRALKLPESNSISSSKTVSIEILRSPDPSAKDLVYLYNQYNILKNLTIPHVIGVLALEPWGDSYALVREDIRAITWREFSQKSANRTVKQSLEIAIQLTDILHDLHQHGVIHKNINPESILIDPANNQIWLTNFGLASLLTKETKSIQTSNSLEGTLAYIAPEQTGRMNRSIDFRTDFYSLGVTLYELLSDRLPFPTDDPIELIYNHLATIPTPPYRVNAEIPVQLSAIVLKLMAKNAEDRYQSALGIKHDLKKCLQQWQENKYIPEFALGKKDNSDRFTVTDKLYGREAEVKVILDSFTRVAKGNSELMLVTGFSGIGKTAVVNEVHKPITQQQGYFIKGKFDQFNRSIPFSAFVGAFDSLVKQLLAESDEELTQWKQAILDALGDNAQVIIEVIPHLEIILGEQPPVTELSGSAAQNRFNLVFDRFIRVFAKQKHPLVVFLDDLQWADAASLDLLQLLMSESEHQDRSLLVLGAYRDNEVFPAHPLMLCLSEIARNKAALDKITLNPLKESDINCLVADTLLCSQAITASLSGLIYQKTQGNPFFTSQFLQGLYDDGYINFSREDNGWQCNLNQIGDVVFTDDVVKFVSDRMQKLPQATQDVLKLASCIGNRFDLETLTIICDRSEVEITSDLWSALQVGLIIAESQIYRLYSEDEIENILADSLIEYRFFHDRVQQAAYCLFSQSQPERHHLIIARRLLQQYSPTVLQDKIFLVVEQINLGRNLIQDSEQKLAAVRLNLQAGNKALLSTAYDAALNYFSQGSSFLDPLDWQSSRNLCLELHLKLIEAQYLNGNYQQVHELSELIFQHTNSFFEQVRVYELMALTKLGQKKLTEAIQVGLEALSSIDIKISLNPKVEVTQQIINELDDLLQGRSLSDLAHHSDMSNPEAIAAMRILNTISVPAYLTSAQLFLLVVLIQVKILFSKGNCATSASVYARYGIILCGALDRIDLGYQSGKFALQLLEKLDNPEAKTRTLMMVGNLVLPWKQHLRKSIPLLNQAYDIGFRSGNFAPASLVRIYESQLLYLSGEPLDRLEKQLNLYSDCINRLKQSIPLSFNELIEQVVSNLRSTNLDPTLLAPTLEAEQQLIKNYQNTNYNFGLFGFYFYKATLNYLFNRVRVAQELITKARDYISGVTGQPVVPLLAWYDSLIYLQSLDSADRSSQAEISFSPIEDNVRDLSKWADYAPMNFQHKWDLIEAEKYRLLDHKLAALEAYDRAIAGAKENQYIQEEALANELAAKFYLDWGKEKIAAVYLQSAHECYARWGATAKTKHLEENYPGLLSSILQAKNCDFNHLETLSSLSKLDNDNSQKKRVNSSAHNSFNLTAILQSARILTETLDLEELLKQLSETILHNSGCDRIIIALQDNRGGWQINVSGSAENLVINLNPTQTSLDNPYKLINYVEKTQEIVVVNNLANDLPIIDNYLFEQQPKSIFATPLKYQAKVIGVLYLHSSHIESLFDANKITVVEFLCSQAAIALNNARLFADGNLKSKAIASSVDGMAILEDDLFTYLNERHLEFFGYELEELIGKSWRKLYSLAEAARIQQEAFPILKTNGKWNGEVTALGKDGTTFPQEISLFLLGDRKLICICRDISQRKIAEQALIKSEIKFRTLVDNVEGAVYRCQLDRDWTIHYVSPFVEQLTGYSVDELVKNPSITFQTIIHPEDRERCWQTVQKAIEIHQVFTLEYRIFHKDGDIRWIYERGKAFYNDAERVEYLEGVMIDISDRKASEKALEVSAVRDKTIFDCASVGFIEIDIATHKFTRANDLFCQMTGYSAGELSQMKFQELTSPEDLQHCLKLLNQLLSGETDKFFTEKRFLHKNGHYLWCETTAYPIEFEGESIKTIFAIVKDVSARKVMERKLEFTQYGLDHAADCFYCLDEDARIIQVNQASCDHMGYSKEELLSMKIHDLAPTCSKESTWQTHWEKLKRLKSYSFETVHQTASGEIFPVEVVCNYFEFDGQSYSFDLVRDITERRQAEEALTAIVEGTAAKTGADFYQACVCFLSEIFKVKYGFLAKFDPKSPLTSKMLVLWDGKEFVEPYEMDMKGTPCLKTYEKNIYIAHDSLSELFPEADKLALLNMESYASITITNSQGQAIGNLGIMDNKALPTNSSTVEFVLQLFATRVGAEMERQITEDALRKSRAQLEAFVNNAPSVIYQKDLQGRYQIFNQNLVDLFNLDRDTRDTFIGCTDSEIFPDDIAQQLIKNDQQIIVSKTASTFEEEILHADGSIHIYISNKFPLLDKQGQVYAIGGISTDITALKQAELALQESKAQFQRMTENVPGMIYRYVVHPDGSDEFTYVSSQVEQTFEIEPKIALQNTDSMWARVHPDDVSILDLDIRTSAEILQPTTISFRIITPKKGIRWIQDISCPERLDNGDIVWDGIVLDITERKLIEAEQQRQLEILETTSDFVGTADTQGEVLYLNEAWRNLLLQDKAKPYQRKTIAEHHPAWALEIIRNEALPTAARQGMWSGETAILDGNGGEIPVSQVVIAHKSKDGEVECFSTIIRDISDRKQIEAKLLSTNEKLARATRLKDEFLANMSHELRTPLNAILGMTEGLEEGIFGKLDRNQTKAIQTIEQSGSHLLELIDDILDLTKIESGKVDLEYSSVEVDRLCQSSLDFVTQQAQKKLIQLHLNTPFNLPNIEVDERRIRQVLINLLNNAVKFTPENGRVTLEVTILPPERTEDPSYLRFSVKDTGIGIAEKDLPKLFQPFVQIDSSLNRQYEGTGLGLFLVKRIIELHQGKVKVDSEVGSGCCFAIELPYQNLAEDNLAPQPKPKPAPILSSPASIASPLILLAEDNNANSSIISTYLKAKGYRVQIAHNGRKAIELAQAEPPELILMDIQMPDMDGLTAIEHIRVDSSLTQTPIIALTAFAMQEDRQKCLTAGANLYLAKPVRLKKLVRSIQKLISMDD